MHLALAALVVGSVLAAPATAETTAAASGGAPSADKVVRMAAGDVVAVGAPGGSGYDVLVPGATDVGGWAVAARFTVAGIDTAGWTGESCVTGSGRFAAVTFAPREFANRPILRDRGAWGGVVDLTNGARWLLPQRVALKYHTPGCGVGDDVAFLRHLGTDQAQTEVFVVDAAARRITGTYKVDGQLTSAVPTGGGIAASGGRSLVSVNPAGVVSVLAQADGDIFDVHAARNGTIDYLVSVPDSVDRPGRLTAYAVDRGGVVIHLAEAKPGELRIALGRGGANRLVGDPIEVDPRVPDHVDPRVEVVRTSTLPEAVSLDGSALVDAVVSKVPSQAPDPEAAGDDAETLVTSHDPRSNEQTQEAPVRREAFVTTDQPPASTSGGTALQPPKCAVPRNDANVQVMQPTGAQVEWAANRAVRGELTTPRPPNWNNNSQPAYSPQGAFPPVALAGGGRIPVQVVLGIAAQEANLKEASYHALPGLAGNPLVGDYYGVTYTSTGQIAAMDYSKADCGYGVMQVTDHMSVTDPYYSAGQKMVIGTDYAANIAAGINVLAQKWNQARAQNLIANNGSPATVENWYFAIWGYNSGINPPSGGNPYGVGWTNNPANRDYAPDRPHFLRTTYEDAAHPSRWPYQERVLGWAESAQLDYTGKPAYTALDDWLNIPSPYTFCVMAVNECDPNYVNTTDVTKSYCTRADRKCWWHGPKSWLSSSSPGRPENPSAYQQGAPEPTATNPHPPSCASNESPTTAPDMPVLPAGAVVVDDVPSSSANIVGCPPMQSGGTFDLSVGTDAAGYPLADADFHQIGGGARGHFWFAHTTDPARTSNIVTGTWRPPASLVGWARVLVHIPDHGADTFQANYSIDTGLKKMHRVVNQRWNQNMWVDLGAFNLGPNASVTLTNATYSDYKIDDPVSIAWDAVAFLPTVKPAVSYVAFGDSFSAGEGVEPYYRNSDVGRYTPKRVNACHRSPQAYAVKEFQALRLRHPGTSELHFVACSGAVMDDMSGSGVQHGEVPQLEQGWLDENTTHVSLTIGGNDAGFADVLTGCILTLSDCVDPDFHLTRHNRVDPAPLVQYEPELIRSLQPAMTALLRRIRQLAPNATITYVGYPQLVDTDLPRWGAACTELFTLGLTQADVNWFADMVDLASRVQQAAASDAGVRWVDARPAFRTHEACSTPGTEWINAVIEYSGSGSGFNMPGSGSFHPKARGQAAYATALDPAFP
jgi:hypothetical protein